MPITTREVGVLRGLTIEKKGMSGGDWVYSVWQSGRQNGNFLPAKTCLEAIEK
jgi:hypothetical protein